MRKVCIPYMQEWASSSTTGSPGEVFQEQMHALLGSGVFNSDGTHKSDLLVMQRFTNIYAGDMWKCVYIPHCDVCR